MPVIPKPPKPFTRAELAAKTAAKPQQAVPAQAAPAQAVPIQAVPAQAALTRKWQRYSVNTVVKVVSIRNAAKQMILGRIGTLSEGGLAFHAPQPLDVDEQIQLEFEVPSTRLPLKLAGVVRHSKNGAHGVEFREMYPHQRQELVRAFASLTPSAARQ